MQEKLMIIDGNSLLYRGFYAMPLLTTSEGLFTNAVYAFINILVSSIEQIKPNYLVVAFDYGKKTFRNNIFADYKAGRKETPMELVSQFPLIKEVLKKMDIVYLEKEGIEADDIIATLSRKFDIEKVILTGDRDSYQLINENTSIFLTKKGVSEVKIVDVKALFDEFGITPSQVVDVKAIMGDKSDNIPGVPGIGEVGAYKLIREFGSLDNVYENIENIPQKALKNKLIAGKESAYMSYKLGLNIFDAELDLELNNCKLNFPFSSEVKDVFRRLEFKSLLKKDIFMEEQKVFDKIENIKIDSINGLDSLIELLNTQENIAIYYDNAQMQFYFGKANYYIDIDTTFLSSGLKFDDCIVKFKEIFENDKITKIVYNYKKMLYDLSMYNFNYKNIFDCSIAKYLLESTAKDYSIIDLCNDFDTDVKSVGLYRAKIDYYSKMQNQNLLTLFNDIEMPLCKVLYNMEVNGVRIDTNILKQYDEKFSNEINVVENKVYELLGHTFNLKSPKQVGEVIYDELKLAVSKKKSTNIENLNSMIDKHPIVPLIIRHRKLVKVKNTYIDSYFKYEKNGFIHSEFNQITTDTGRLSSTNPNLQNIPIRDDEGKFIREVFVSRFDGGFMTSFDYNQIELKLMAHMSGDTNMVNAFNSGSDIHTATASKIYGINESEVTKEQRQSAKAVNFGIIYGQGAFGLSQQLGCSVKRAGEFIEAYFNTFPNVKSYMVNTIEKTKANNNTAVTLFNRQRYIPELAVSNHNLKAFGERVAINMPLQGTASDIIKIAMIKVDNMLRNENFESKLVLQIHDELVFDTKPNELELLKIKVKEIMENIVELKVPLNVSIECGKNLLKD